jgi:hypothetical protein
MEDKKQEAWVLTKSLSTQENLLKEVIHERMVESSPHQAKSDAQKNGKDNEIGLKRHAPYLVRGEFWKLRQLKTKRKRIKCSFC